MKPAYLLIAGLVTSLTALACAGVTPNPRPVEPLWEIADFTLASLPGTASAWAIDYANHIFYAPGADQQLYAWDELTGVTLWQVPAERFRLSADQTLVYAASGDLCAAYDAISGALVQALPPEKNYLCAPGRRDDSSFRFALSPHDAGHHTLSAFDAESGAPLWQTSLELDEYASVFSNPPASEPFLHAGVVVVYTSNYKPGDGNTDYLSFQVFSPQTGERLWQVSDRYFGQAELAGDRVILFYSETGALIPQNLQPAGPFVLEARDMRTGAQLWRTTTDYTRPPALRGDMLYQCAQHGYHDITLLWWDVRSGALEGESGSRAYDCPAPADRGLGPDIRLIPGNRYARGYGWWSGWWSPAARYDGWVSAWRISSGELLWSTAIEPEITAEITGLGDDIALIAWGGRLYRAYRLEQP